MAFVCHDRNELSLMISEPHIIRITAKQQQTNSPPHAHLTLLNTQAHLTL